MEIINIRVSAEEKAEIKHDAHLHEMTVSEYLRWLAREERKCL